MDWMMLAGGAVLAALIVRDVRPRWYVDAVVFLRSWLRSPDGRGEAVAIVGLMLVLQFFASIYGARVWLLGGGVVLLFVGVGFWPMVRTFLWGVYGVAQRFGEEEE